MAAYARTRREAEEAAVDALANGLSVAIARPKTLVGPGAVGAFALLFDLVRGGNPVPALGDGRNRYQLLDVRDFASGLAALATSEATGVFSFGAAEFGTVREDLEELLAFAATNATLRLVPAPVGRVLLRAMELVGLPLASDWHWACARNESSVVAIDRAVGELGWHPARSNVRALIDAYRWFVSEENAAAVPSTVPSTHRLVARAFAQWPS